MDSASTAVSSRWRLLYYFEEPGAAHLDRRASMEMSSAYHDSLDPTNLSNFKNPLNVPGGDGLLGFLDASAGPVELVAQKDRVQLASGE
jgi:hypothetical protein